MGVMDFFKRGTSELMVARPDAAKAQVVWKHPDPTIPMKAQLTVEADEKAVFFRDGKVVATLAAGRHTLDSSNLPFLSNLVDSFTGGNVFITEVFFVNVREQVGVKFGGRIGNVEDPKSGVPVETMVHGEFSFRVTNPETLITGLVGMGRTADGVSPWMKEQVLKIIRDRVAELLVKNKWPLLDVTSGAYTEEIEKDVLAGVGEHVKGYGIVIARLGNFVVDIDDADAANLKRLYTDAAYLKTVGGVANYQQFAAGKAMMGAGEGMAKGGGSGDGGGLMAGAGLAVGMGMAQQMMGAGTPRAAGGGTTPVGVVCAACKATVAAGKFCSSCGKELAPATPAPAAASFCTGCGAPVSADARFCGQCGTQRGG